MNEEHLPVQEVLVSEDFDGDLHSWLEQQGRKNELEWLLAHLDDGICWGRFETDGSLVTGNQVYPRQNAELRSQTLQQAWLFGLKGELHLWRQPPGFAGCLIHSAVIPDEQLEYFDERHWLWGFGETSEDGFTLMEEGQEGLYHTPPLVAADGFRSGLKVRHYIHYDDMGQAYIAFSRLVELVIVEGGQS